jgi:hypothetical protein
MKPWPNLHPVPVSEWVAAAEVGLRADLDLLLKGKPTWQRELPGDILEKSWNRTQALGVQGRNRKQTQRHRAE